MTTAQATVSGAVGAAPGLSPFALLAALVPDWTEQGACAQSDPEAFFPEKGESARDAKKVCGRCVVAAECLEYALKNDERHGVWGGKSERDRRRLRRRTTTPPATPQTLPEAS